MPCRVLTQVEVLPFLEGKAGQSMDDCSYKGLRRIAKPSCLRNWGETIRKHASELKDQAKKRAEGSPCKGHEIERGSVWRRSTGTNSTLSLLDQTRREGASQSKQTELTR